MCHIQKRSLYSLALLAAILICITCALPTYADGEGLKIEDIIRNENGTYTAVDKDGRSVIKEHYTYVAPYYTPAGEYYKIAYTEGKSGVQKQGIVDAYGHTVIPLIEGKIKWIFFDDQVANYYVGQSTHAYDFKGKKLTPSGYTNSEWGGNGFIIGIKYQEPIQIPPPDATGPGRIIDNTTRTLITPGGLEFPMIPKENVLEISHVYGTKAFDDYAMVASQEGTKIIHKSKGIVYQNYAKNFPMDTLDDKPFMLGLVDNEAYVLLDMDCKQLSPPGITYTKYRRTPSGLVLSNSEVTHYYWNEGSLVSESEMASFDLGQKPWSSSRIYAFDGDPNWTVPSYYPTAAKEAIDFSKDENIYSRLWGITLGNSAKAAGNQLWMNHETTPDQSEAVITFEGNNSVRISLTDYDTGIKMFLMAALVETFDRKVIYQAVETIQTDIESVFVNRKNLYSQNSEYYTNRLDGLKKTVGYVTLEYKDQEDLFEILMTYPDDIYAKGMAAYEASLDRVVYPEVTVESGSMASYLRERQGGSSFTSDEFYPALSSYLGKKYKTGKNYQDHLEVYVHPLKISHYGYKTSGDYGTKDVEIEYSAKGLTLTISEYTDKSKEFIRYFLDGYYTAEAAKYAYEKIFSDIENMMAMVPADFDTKTLINRMQGRVVTAGPFVIEYTAKSLVINVAYPIYDYDQLKGGFTYEADVVNKGYGPDRSMTYVYNYFRPYGPVLGQFEATEYGVDVTPSGLYYCSEVEYIRNDYDVRVSDMPNNRVSINFRNQRRPFGVGDESVTEFLEDYFKLAYGKENATLLMAQIHKTQAMFYLQMA